MNLYRLTARRVSQRAGWPTFLPVLQLFLILFFVVNTVRAQAPAVHIYSGLPIGYATTQVMYNNGLYAAVFNSPGRIFTSTDADNWNQASVFPSFVNIKLAYGNGVYVMTWDADSGRIGLSNDLVHWTFQKPGTGANLRDVEFLNGSFYTVGDSATFLRSTDGLNWTALHPEISGASISYAQVIYGNGCFVINAQDTLNRYTLYRSADLSDGSLTPTFTAGNSFYIPIKFVKDKFYFLWGYDPLYSTDGIDWSQSVSWPNPGYPFPDAFSSIFSDGEKFYLVAGASGTGTFWTDIYVSTDGITFSGSFGDAFQAGDGVYLGQNYFLYGFFGMAKSKDGLSYQPMGGNYSYLASNGQTFVAAGTIIDGPYLGQGLLGSSTDLVHWTNRTIPNTGASATMTGVSGLLYDGTNFLTGGYRSPDGENWTATNAQNQPNAYGNGVYILGPGCYSYDGINWTCPYSDLLYGQQATLIKFVNGRFIVTGYKKDGSGLLSLVVSSDGINWTDASPHLSFNATVTDVLYDSSKYYLVGIEKDSTGKAVGFFSVTNTDISNPDGYTDKGGVDAAGPLLTPTFFAWSNGHFAGGATDSAGDAYVLYASDGIHWGAVPLNIVNTINAAMGRADSIVLIANENVSIAANFAGGTLPLSLLDFNAVAQDGQSLLNWHTGEEENTGRFVVERSVDGVHWDSIGVVTAAGQSNVTLGYSYVDVSPKKGYDYYRLGMVDIDGRQQLSAVKRVRIGDAGTIRIYPNPVRDVLTLEMAEDGAGRVQLYNSTGVGVLTQEFSGYTVNLALGALPGGVYHLVIQQNGKKYVQEIFHN